MFRIARSRSSDVTYLPARSSVLNLVQKAAAIMSLKKIVNAIGLGQSRADRMKRISRARSTKLVFSDLGFELEKRQLLATFSYSSGLLTIQTDSANEQLSIISTSESGNYTITTTGTWSGSAVSGLSNTSTNLYVNQPSGLASILINDNNGTV